MSDILDTRFEGRDIELNANFASVGDDINILAKDPGLKSLHVGVGWDVNAFDADAVDVDFSIFLIGKDGKTREDADFVFYNNPKGLNGAIEYSGDSRTGMGDGDDESFFINLQGVPFDIFKIVFVISIYRGYEKQQGIRQIQNGYLRLVNADSNTEIVRFDLSKIVEERKDTGIIAGSLNREGPKWHFTPLAEYVEGGLAEIAQHYGCVIVQS